MTADLIDMQFTAKAWGDAGKARAVLVAWDDERNTTSKTVWYDELTPDDKAKWDAFSGAFTPAFTVDQMVLQITNKATGMRDKQAEQRRNICAEMANGGGGQSELTGYDNMTVGQQNKWGLLVTALESY